MFCEGCTEHITAFLLRFCKWPGSRQGGDSVNVASRRLQIMKWPRDAHPSGPEGRTVNSPTPAHQNALGTPIRRCKPTVTNNKIVPTPNGVDPVPLFNRRPLQGRDFCSCITSVGLHLRLLNVLPLRGKEAAHCVLLLEQILDSAQKSWGFR